MNSAWKWSANSCIPTTLCCSVEWSSLMTGAMPAAVWGCRATACCADWRFDPVYHGHFKCNRTKLSEMPVLWAYTRDLFQTPGFGDTTDFVQIKQHYYIVHSDINPTRIVPKGPDLAGWLTSHGREALGSRPFGDGTPPGPPLEGERVPAGHGP
jgi:hypothetical protein